MNRWEGLDEFVAVAECGQFTAAAERLGVSSSHVSRQVARLEECLQARLLYRSTRRVSLTEAGQTFLQHCRHLLTPATRPGARSATCPPSPRACCA